MILSNAHLVKGMRDIKLTERRSIIQCITHGELNQHFDVMVENETI